MLATKRIVKMMKLALLIVILASSYGCKQDVVENTVETLIVATQLLQDRPFLEEEMIAGNRICRSLRRKRLTFPMNHMQQPFSFELTYSPCKGEKNHHTIHAMLARDLAEGTLYYATQENNPLFLHEIFTESNDPLSYVCPTFLKNKNLNNTFQYNRDGIDSIRFTFMAGPANSIHDTAKVSYLKGTTNKDRKVVKELTMDVVTRESVEIPYVGLVLSYKLSAMCDGSLVDNFSQIYRLTENQ